MLPIALAPSVISSLAPVVASALVPLAKELVSAYTSANAKREEEHTKRVAIAGETRCRVNAIEMSGQNMQSRIEGDTALEMQRCRDVGSLLHQPAVLDDPQKFSQALDAMLSLQQAQHARSKAQAEEIMALYGR